ncbi:MAG: hypothetical protein WAR83_04845 [Flavobacteriales bacterium]
MRTVASATQRTAFFTLIFLFGLSLFAVAMGMKWMKWPGGSAMLIISAVLATVGSFVQVGKSADRALVMTMRSAMAVTLIYAVWRLLYWPGTMVVALCALVLGIAALVLWWRSDQVRKGALAAMLVVLTGGAALMATPVHAVYGYMMLETPGARRFIHSGVGQWYKYSWLLYQDGQYSKSMVMIDSAMAIVSDHHVRTGSSGEWILVKLDSTRDQIAAHEWNEFHELAK